jgi:DNA helicase-2/ATP-dependent DNA helicase PcrA
VAPSSTLETVFVAEEIQSLIAKGVSPSEITVLYRNNADATLFADTFAKWQIPFQVQLNDDVLNQPEIVQFLKLCQVICDLRSAKESLEFYEVLNYSWLGVDHLLAMTIARAAAKSRMTIYERICKGYADFAQLQLNDHVTPLDFAVLEQLVEKLEKWGQLDAEMTFPAWFELVLNESGYLPWISAQPNKIEILLQLNALFRELKNLSLSSRQFHLQDFLNAITTMREHGVQIAVEEFQSQEDAVTLSTVHKAKGREWEYVFLVQLIDSKWGNTRKISSIVLPPGILQQQDLSDAERLADDRRLFYVALTRAKKRLTISYPETLISNNQSKPAMGSVFLSEIPAEYLQPLERPELAHKTEEFLTKLLTLNTTHVDHSAAEKLWLTQVVSQYRLSVSGLNAYLRSPQNFLDEVLLRVPKARPEYQAFGTAIHSALEFVFRQLEQTNQFPSHAETYQHFLTALDREVLTPEQHFIWAEHGKEVLEGYVNEYAGQTKKPLFLEKKLGYGAPLLLGDISLVGQIDRMEWADESHSSLCVIDYKTGKPRTLNEIEGKVGTQEFSVRELELPQPIRGPYKRQLLFYKLLVQLDGSFKVKVSEGVFDFVEPNDTGKFVQRQFALEDKDVELLKELIVEVMAEIRSLKFLDLSANS